LEIEIIKMYAIIDIETTGGKFDSESITEIAILKYDGEKILDQFSSLVNPEKEIDSFVKKLTGINNQMLKNAPKFFNIAKRIINITDDCVLVAHNASFDYRVLKTEFRRLGYNYSKKTLCTVNLSKKLIPNKNSYSLGKLTKNLGIPLKRNHRALDDAIATFNLFKLLQDHDLEKKILKKEIKNLRLNSVSINILKYIDKIPSKIGIYYFYNEKKEIVFIGMSSNLKKKVLNHFIKNDKKSNDIIKKIKTISFSLTGNKIIAVLKMKNEINKISPFYNKKENNFQMRKNIYNKKSNYPFNSFLIIDKGREIDEFSFLYIKNKKFIGYGFFELNHQIKNNQKINSRLIEVIEDNKIKKIINKLFVTKNFIKIIEIKN
tara:strand:+ start:2530 stop:3657 length:1128 start_codon:yes stop_codon:yes gene_type:complete